MNIGDFMTLALGHADHGYYMTRDPFGRAGDFTTAPEISQMFGELLGLWAADIWIKLGSPTKFQLIECGPGRGTLMADALRATKNVPGFHAAAEIVLLEISPVLKKKQQEALHQYDVTWVDELSYPAIQSCAAPVILLANEFLDALPIEQWEYVGNEWRERVLVIDAENNNLSFSNSDQHKPETITVTGQAKTGDVYETSAARAAFVCSVAKIIKKRRGGALFVDYGHEGGIGDTLQAVQSHKFAPVLKDIGNADLTSHVDFSALKNAITEGAVYGPVTQGAFLVNLGLRERAKALNQEEERLRLSAPGQMGRLFKVMALCHDVEPEGFACT